MKFRKVEFITTVTRCSNLPFFGELPEIAVAGRSNVGKSSLLNHLFGVKGLVKTSSTPGKTRALNFFKVNDKWVCVDMPGYGYAAVPHSEIKQWRELVEGYLNTRSTLKVLLFLFDIRREPNEQDEQMLEWIAHRQIPALLILTKVDKVSKSARAAHTRRITDRLKGLPYVHYSATKNEGRKELIARLSEFNGAS